jgi:hypothetical protein
MLMGSDVKVRTLRIVVNTANSSSGNWTMQVG